MQTATCTISGCESPVFVKSRGWCRKHYYRWHRTGDPLQAKYDRDDRPDRWRYRYKVDEVGCWIWTGHLDRHGYGDYSTWVDGRRKTLRAHRYIYEQLRGPVPSSLDLDHLCRVPACVNPDHLEPVTHAENVSRGRAGAHNAAKTHCINGHEFTPENTRLHGPDHRWRECRTCVRESGKIAQRKYRGVLEVGVSNALKTHCIHGHEFTPENTKVKDSGGRQCITCRRQYNREYQRKLHGTLPDAVPNGQKTHCIHGHEFTPENTYVTANGGRSCRACTRAFQAAYRERLAAKDAEGATTD